MGMIMQCEKPGLAADERRCTQMKIRAATIHRLRRFHRFGIQSVKSVQSVDRSFLSAFIRVHLRLLCIFALAGYCIAAAPTSQPTQQFCLPETDPNSPRKSKLKSEKPDPNE